MIVHLKEEVREEQAQQLARQLEATIFKKNGRHVLVTPSKLKELQQDMLGHVDEYFVSENDIQLAGKHYRQGKRSVNIGQISVGGDNNNTIVMAGPCSVESEEQIRQSAELLVGLGITTMRAGSYKPRTSPYSFQGLGLKGLQLLAKMREEYGLNIITEVRDATHIEEVIEHSDIVQVGAKSMYDHGILRRCGQIDKPVLLKRGFGSTLQEFVQAAEFILSGGNENVILCERGIRTFETKTRFTLDLSGAAWLKYHTNLPIVLDPSHGMGYAYGVPDLARACVALGVEGLLIEVHPDPKMAKSDASQQLGHEEFKVLHASLKNVAMAVGRTLV